MKLKFMIAFLLFSNLMNMFASPEVNQDFILKAKYLANGMHAIL